MKFERREINIGSSISINIGENGCVTTAEETVSRKIEIQPTDKSGRITDVYKCITASHR
jgi:hypothetical protein